MKLRFDRIVMLAVAGLSYLGAIAAEMGPEGPRISSQDAVARRGDMIAVWNRRTGEDANLEQISTGTGAGIQPKPKEHLLRQHDTKTNP